MSSWLYERKDCNFDAMSHTNRPKLVYIIAYPKRWPMAESICQLVDKDQFDVSVILLHQSVSPLAGCLDSHGIPYFNVSVASRLGIFRAAYMIYRYCATNNVDIVHAHFMNACLSGLVAARLAGVPVRIHTRHHAGPLPRYHRGRLGQWYDRWNNWFSSMIIAPCEQTQAALVKSEGVEPQRTRVIYHGFDLATFPVPSQKRVAQLKHKYGLNNQGPVIGVVSRFEKIKGVQYIIPAFARLLEVYPEARLVLAHASGSYKAQIVEQLNGLPQDRVTLIEFEDDIVALYGLFDVFVNVPMHSRMEGFGQTYVESLAAGVPAVFTRAGIANEYPRDPPIACFVDFKNSEQIYQRITELLTSRTLRETLVQNARHFIKERFDIVPMVRKMEALYIAQLQDSRTSFKRQVNIDGKLIHQGDVASDGQHLVRQIHANLCRYGYCYLAFPHSVDEYERLASGIGSVELRTEVRIDKKLDKSLTQTRAAGNSLKRPGAHRAEGLSLHSDRPTVDVLGFHCQTQDVSDGTLILVDTRHIGAWFSEQELDKLAKIRIRFTIRDEHTHLECFEYQPVVFKTGDYYHVYYAPWFFPDSPTPGVAKLLNKLTEFITYQQAKAPIPIRLNPSESVFLDNKRMLHGRGPIAPDSKRHLVRLYLVSRDSGGN